VQWIVKSSMTSAAENRVRLLTFRNKPPWMSALSSSITGWNCTWMSSIQMLKARLQF
jgi:hypothetical protein